MGNNLHSNRNTQLIVKIPATIISNKQLSLNEKLILGLHYTFDFKLGKTSLTNKQIGQLFHLHPNIVSYCHKNLLQKGFITKMKSTYTVTYKHLQTEIIDKREIYIPYQVYNHPKLNTGSKLLWGEYNSISKGHREYFAKRSYTSQRLNVSEESITNWTKQLREYQVLKSYTHKRGYGKSQKMIVTCSFQNN
ncbi:hypothetical protein [Winogradskyella sp. 4-2091]|uniref:hypothetical protein n=1 Tax=Winogradskyella sp. 4-2091 TaxID=3381659 RepID=UPI003891E3DC